MTGLFCFRFGTHLEPDGSSPKQEQLTLDQLLRHPLGCLLARVHALWLPPVCYGGPFGLATRSGGDWGILERAKESEKVRGISKSEKQARHRLHISKSDRESFLSFQD